MARQSSGTFVVRMEDLDPPRVVAGSAERILDDLDWLGLHEDEGPRAGGPHAPYVQSARNSIYEDAVATLAKARLTYACDCSRAEIALVASAPHEGEDLVYPGTCRGGEPKREMRRPPAIRFSGRDVGVDDFVLRRGDGVYAYQLAVAVDDLAMNIDCVVRGEDLASSTPRQLAIMRSLGATTIPTYVHVPLVRDAGGARISKRTAGARVRALREGGISPSEVMAVLSQPRVVVPLAWERLGA